MVVANQLHAFEGETRHIHGPVADAVLLGGGSMLLWLVVRFGLGLGKAESFAAAMVLANLINHLHFAHSYQVFYRSFHQNITSHQPGIRARHLLAGVVVPLALIGLLAAAIVTKSMTGLSLAVKLMIFSVGWHYAKQAYRMAMVNSVFKKHFFSQAEKTSCFTMPMSPGCPPGRWCPMPWPATNSRTGIFTI